MGHHHSKSKSLSRQANTSNSNVDRDTCFTRIDPVCHYPQKSTDSKGIQCGLLIPLDKYNTFLNSSKLPRDIRASSTKSLNKTSTCDQNHGDSECNSISSSTETQHFSLKTLESQSSTYTSLPASAALVDNVESMSSATLLLNSSKPTITIEDILPKRDQCVEKKKDIESSDESTLKPSGDSQIPAHNNTKSTIATTSNLATPVHETSLAVKTQRLEDLSSLSSESNDTIKMDSSIKVCKEGSLPSHIKQVKNLESVLSEKFDEPERLEQNADELIARVPSCLGSLKFLSVPTDSPAPRKLKRRRSTESMTRKLSTSYEKCTPSLEESSGVYYSIGNIHKAISQKSRLTKYQPFKSKEPKSHTNISSGSAASTIGMNRKKTVADRKTPSLSNAPRLKNYLTVTADKKPQAAKQRMNRSTSLRPDKKKNEIKGLAEKIVAHVFVRESVPFMSTVTDPTDRRVRAITDRFACDIDVFAKQPFNGFLQYPVAIRAPSFDILRKCAKMLDTRLQWNISWQITSPTHMDYW